MNHYIKHIIEGFDFNSVKSDKHNDLHKFVDYQINDFINAIKDKQKWNIDLSEYNAIYAPANKEELLELIRKYIFILTKYYSINLNYDTVNLNWLDVSNIDDMSNLFGPIYTYIYKIDISKWDVSNVLNMQNLFLGCEDMQPMDISNWDVSNVLDMSRMFYQCYKFNCDLSKWNVSNVIDMDSMFCGCKHLDTDLSKWDVSNVKDMRLMFFNCVNFNNNISNWDVSNVTNMIRMFKYCINFNQNLNKWKVPDNIKCMEMFDDCNALRKRPDWYDKYKYCNEGFNFDSIKKDSVHNNILKNIKESFDFNIIDNTNKNKQEKILSGVKVYIIRSYIERLLNRDTSLLEDKEFIKIISSDGIYKVRSKEEIRSIYEAGLDVVGTRFYLGWLNTSEITDMSELFRNMDGDPELKGIDKWDVSNVKNMKAMFLGCSSFDEDLGNWNTSNVINMSLMFSGCRMFDGRGLDKWNTSNVTNMSAMFGGCQWFNANLGNWDVSNVLAMNAMFRYCDKYQGNGLENWDVSKVTTMAEMFYCCPALKKDNIANWKPKILSLPFLDRTIALSLIFKSGTTHIPKWIRNALKEDKK